MFPAEGFYNSCSAKGQDKNIPFISDLISAILWNGSEIF
jgi:hypothetical protein